MNNATQTKAFEMLTDLASEVERFGGKGSRKTVRETVITTEIDESAS